MGIGGSGLALRSVATTCGGFMNVSAGGAIARSVCIASFVVFLGTNGTGVIAQQASPSIREQVHEPAGFERIVVSTYDPLQLSSLVARADLIVEASTAGGRSYLNTAETDIFTDYPSDER